MMDSSKKHIQVIHEKTKSEDYCVDWIQSILEFKLSKNTN